MLLFQGSEYLSGIMGKALTDKQSNELTLAKIVLQNFL